MEWDPNERDAWVFDAQRWISSIKGVLQCKIDLDAEGEVSGVHVVAGMDREPRHIVRDVESLLKARLEMDVFYKKIGVVQVLDNGAEADSGSEKTPSSLQTEAISQPTPVQKSSSASIPEQSPEFSGVTFHPADDDGLQDEPLPGLGLGSGLKSEIESELSKGSDQESLNQFGNFAGGIAEDIAEDTAKETAKETAEETAEDNKSAAKTIQTPSAGPIPAVLLAEAGPLRVVCSGVGVMASDMLVRAEVQLKIGNVEVRGIEEGANHSGSAIVLVARATLNALTQIVVDPIVLHLQEVRSDHLGDENVILCAVNLVEGRKSETLFGSCSNLHNEQQAVVFSVMDALNRRLSLFSLKADAAEG
ncbi:MAG: hypothetical protein GY780_13475 [bacterium]|nr:hypothetical protein [bacterium]